MKSYVKIYGPPLGKAIEALRKVALDVPEVCVMDRGLEEALTLPVTQGGLSSSGELDYNNFKTFFGSTKNLSEERCNTIISKSGKSLGEYDFFYEWFKKPAVSQVEDLIEKIDKALARVGVRYSLTTK